MQDLLKELNEEQRKAVTTTEGPLLIVAGAGTGKTKVVTSRAAYIISSKGDIAPSNILALTFSKKAAAEMLERIEDFLQEHKDEIWVMTFHSFCNRVLRDYSQEVGLPGSFVLLDRVQQWIFFKSILADLKLKHFMRVADPSECIDGFLKFISRAKDELVFPEDYQVFAESITDSQERSRQKEVARAYQVYQEKMHRNGMLDFGDLIIYTMKLFKENPSMLKKFQQQFKYFIIDEFQDTNVAQIEVVSLLASASKNICAVGDDDQGIYRFRGASYASFLKFKEKFPELKSVTLTQNYRSTKKILAISQRLIRYNNVDRYDPDKNLWTQNKSGPDIYMLTSNNYSTEARLITKEIIGLYRTMPKDKADYCRIAVLYRAHFHKEELMKNLNAQAVPFTVVGSVGLFEQEEINDIICFLKFINNPMDNISLFKILSDPTLRIDVPSLVKLSTFAAENGISLYEALSTPEKAGLDNDTAKCLKDTKNLLNELIRASRSKSPEDLLHELLEKTGLWKHLLSSANPEDELKVINIGRFFKFINKYTQQYKEKKLGIFLEYLDSYIEAGGDFAEEEEFSEQTNAVQLMTVHQAKGLEFDFVFVIGLVQNRFPSRPKPEAIPFPVELMKEKLPKGDFHIQEERRLCYVAMTRAKEALFLSCVDKPYHKPSVFLSEIKPTEAKEASFIREGSSSDYEEDLMDILVPMQTNTSLLGIRQRRKISAILAET